MTKYNYYPAALNVTGKKCLVVGDDREALEKLTRLRDAGARVTVVTPDSFKIERITDQFLVVFCVKTDPKLTKAVAKVCRQKRVLLCAIDQPEYCDVVNVSVFDKGRLRIAIGTGGSAPSISKKIRMGLEQSLKDSPVDEFLDDLAELRDRLDKQYPDSKERIPQLLQATDGFEFRATVHLPTAWASKKLKRR